MELYNFYGKIYVTLCSSFVITSVTFVCVCVCVCVCACMLYVKIELSRR
jgi:hypothetical protein